MESRHLSLTHYHEKKYPNVESDMHPQLAFSQLFGDYVTYDDINHTVAFEIVLLFFFPPKARRYLHAQRLVINTGGDPFTYVIDLLSQVFKTMPSTQQ